VGSNIEPERNVRAALRSLARCGRIVGVSTFYRTDPIGHPCDPQFVNGVVGIDTPLGAQELKESALRTVERELGRRRGPDANAPRTIDLDLLLYDRDLPDRHVEDRPFVALPLLELDPKLSLPGGRPLRELAERLPRDGMVALPELTAQLRAEVQDG
jgi:2-amino-4-hydroxy-6-hydroxymethyldihydropteridine diphosphokinase